MEIERKFLVESIPDDLRVQYQMDILQGYMCVSNAGSEVRLRKMNDQHYLSHKSPGNLVREEIEMEIPQRQFDLFWPTTIGRRIEKVRYIYFLDFHGTLKFELDVFKGKLEGLVLGEIEFTSDKAALEFAPPKWFGMEVTQVNWLKNNELWKFPSVDFLLNKLSTQLY